MSMIDALRMCELLLGAAFAQQSIEHCLGPVRALLLFLPRLVLSLLLALTALLALPGPWVVGVEAALLLCAVAGLFRFDGAYNGGSDRLGLLVLCCVLAARAAPSLMWAQVALGYLAVQLVLSYFMAGWAKVLNPAWRNGRALRDVFAFSAYPASEQLRGWQDWPRLLWLVSWGVMLLELLFPFALCNRHVLLAMLTLAAIFHLINACAFGFNRFFWVWLAAYPALLWFQLWLQLWFQLWFQQRL